VSATLERRDFVAALRDRPEPVDIAWLSLSLHHLPAPAKLSLMREVRGVIGDHGLFLIYDNTSPDGEVRDPLAFDLEVSNPRATSRRPAARTGSSASQIPARKAAPTVRWSCGLR
jgi:hypothetical protein